MMLRKQLKPLEFCTGQLPFNRSVTCSKVWVALVSVKPVVIWPICASYECKQTSKQLILLTACLTNRPEGHWTHAVYVDGL